MTKPGNITTNTSTKLDIFENLVSPPDLGVAKLHVQEFFWDTAAQPQASTHIKAQTDGRISQTIFGIPSNQAKRDFFPGFLA